jgi:hypothetical protein
MNQSLPFVIIAVLALMIVPNVSSVYGMIEMLIELEGTGDDEFTIESMEVNETANDNGIYVMCNYVSGCEYEWQDDAEVRPNTVSSNDFVLEGTLHLIHKDLDTGNDEIEVLDIRSDLSADLITEEENDEGEPITQYMMLGNLEIGGMGLTGLMNLGERTALAYMNVTDDGDAAVLLLQAF